MDNSIKLFPCCDKVVAIYRVDGGPLVLWQPTTCASAWVTDLTLCVAGGLFACEVANAAMFISGE